MKLRLSGVLLTALAVSDCGGEQQDPGENTAEQLDNAAEQSDPAAAPILENAADQVRAQNSTAPAQGALEAAGNAQAGTPPTEGNSQ